MRELVSLSFEWSKAAEELGTMAAIVRMHSNRSSTKCWAYTCWA